jgi:cellulose/xylan binding protein with CBM9 domain
MLIIEIMTSFAVAAAPLADQAQQQPAPSEPRPAMTATAQRAAQPPAIDGHNNDAIWQSAPKFSEFRQFDPKPSSDPSFRTEFQVSYDDRNLYVYVRAYDPHPDSIMRALSRRDVRGPSDQIIVFIDSYNDRRSGFDFNVNPDGVKRDYAIFNDGEEDGSWNGVWDVGTVVDSLGWAAEFRIPLSQLRYTNADSHTFGFAVWRDIERYRERVAWPEYVPTRTGLVSQFGRLDGITGITSPRRVELTPYSVAKNVTREASAGGFERAQQMAVGADHQQGASGEAGSKALRASSWREGL